MATMSGQAYGERKGRTDKAGKKERYEDLTLLVMNRMTDAENVKKVFHYAESLMQSEHDRERALIFEELYGTGFAGQPPERSGQRKKDQDTTIKAGVLRISGRKPFSDFLRRLSGSSGEKIRWRCFLIRRYCHHRRAASQDSL